MIAGLAVAFSVLSLTLFHTGQPGTRRRCTNCPPRSGALASSRSQWNHSTRVASLHCPGQLTVSPRFGIGRGGTSHELQPRRAGRRTPRRKIVQFAPSDRQSKFPVPGDVFRVLVSGALLDRTQAGGQLLQHKLAGARYRFNDGRNMLGAEPAGCFTERTAGNDYRFCSSGD